MFKRTINRIVAANSEGAALWYCLPVYILVPSLSPPVYSSSRHWTRLWAHDGQIVKYAADDDIKESIMSRRSCTEPPSISDL